MLCWRFQALYNIGSHLPFTIYYHIRKLEIYFGLLADGGKMGRWHCTSDWRVVELVHNLNICRLSRRTCSAKGGDEVVLLCDKIKKGKQYSTHVYLSTAAKEISKVTRKPCCCKETARCRKCSFLLKFANNIHYKYKTSQASKAATLQSSKHADA